MNSQDAKKITSKLPNSPGVYLFLRKKKILYVGKATSLKDRVRSYFNSKILESRGPLISKMLSEFDSIKHIKTDSVLEALILEANLIKKYQPEANIKEKDDRSFNFVVITDEDFPRVLIVRGRELEKVHKIQTHKLLKPHRVTLCKRYHLGESEYIGLPYVFGPFPNSGQLREALKIIRKMFPYRDKCIPCADSISTRRVGMGVSDNCRPCFNRQIGLCPGVCTGEISEKDYAKIIKNIILFFEGKKKKLVKNLEKEMKNLARKKEFEKAGKVKKTIFSLNHIQDVSLIKEKDQIKNLAIGDSVVSSRLVHDSSRLFRIESYDIAHISGQNMVGVMVVVENGEKNLSEYRKFKIKENTGVNDTKALSEVLERRLGHPEWRQPDLIVVDGGIAQKNAIEKIIKKYGLNIPVVSVVKNEKHRPEKIMGDKRWLAYEGDILLSNSEAHRFAIKYHKRLREKI